MNIENLNQQPKIAQIHSCQELFDQAPAGYLITDQAGLVQEANQVAAHLFGVANGQLLGKSLAAFVAAESLEQFLLMLAQSQQDSAGQSAEICFVTPQGNSLHTILSINAVFDLTGQVAGLRWLIQDISDRKQTETQLQQQVEQGKWLGAIARRIRQSLNPQEILDATATATKSFFQADRVLISRARPNGDWVNVTEALESGWTSVLGFAVEKEWVTERLDVYQQKGAYTIHNIEQASLSPRSLELLHHYQIQALLSIPIIQDEQVLAFLSVHQCRSPRNWQMSEIDALQQLADHLATALHQSELYQQIQRLNADLEKEVQRRTIEVQRAVAFESMLKRITDKVRDSLDESQILETAVRELTLVLGLSGCNAALYDLDQGTSTIHYEYIDSIPAYQGRVAQMNHFPEIYSQLRQGYYFQFCSLSPNPVRGQVAMLACPIFVDSESSQGVEQVVLGDLWLINHKDYVFNEFEIRLVRQVANQCAIAIRQARLYQAAQVQVRELERLNRLKDEFLSTVSHELRTPISNVKMAIHMLRTATTEEKRQRYLEILDAESTREAELINDLLDLQRLEDACYPITFEVIRLQDWLPGIIEPFHTRTTVHDQILDVSYPSDLLPMVADPVVLRRILAELLNNACKYTVPAGEIYLKVSQESNLGLNLNSTTVFTLRNRANIPHSELPHIFEKFYRVPNADPWKRGGTGLGLALVQKLVEQSGGTIKAESTDGWTSFTVRLPTQIQTEI
ncbi:GAF domain-containing protein [Leptolyngbya sp. FACHB-671]|uniref:GAF domain-containing protein n=1 Tax=Leptolyngbya sp. FACHB-671 TaxID=2692812 RepID=UPI0019C21BAF|nr:GAF domain-containing protein [Leptolyngbya sp. FACHB-671]